MIGRLRERRSDAMLAALALAGLLLVALLTRPPQEAALDTYSAGDTRSGGYAAWDALLQREGVAVEHFQQRPIELDGTIDTLIDAYGVEAMPGDARLPADTDALAAWVRAGGRLIVIGSDASVVQRERQKLARPIERTARASGGTLHGPAFGDAIASLATFSRQRFVPAKRRTRVLLADRGGAIVERVAFGRGAIVYVSDPRMFSNAAIARDDNARLAYLLARPRRAGRIVAFDEALHAAIVERGWVATLSVPVRVALAGTVLVILIALAGGALRLGPPVTLRVVREPASDEFIRAIASLYARAGARREAIALLAAAADGPDEPAMQLRALRERPQPTDADLIQSATLARALRKDHR
jgi:hypothetical protein